MATESNQVNIYRMRRSDQGTEGILCYCDFTCYVMELPWRDNERNYSCIAAGTYKARLRRSPRFGLVYWILEVDGRTYILIHSGNLAGDVKKELKTHTNGCILAGKYFGWLHGQRAVLLSRPTVRRLTDALGGQEFTLTIHEAFGG